MSFPGNLLPRCHSQCFISKNFSLETGWSNKHSTAQHSQPTNFFFFAVKTEVQHHYSFPMLSDLQEQLQPVQFICGPQSRAAFWTKLVKNLVFLAKRSRRRHPSATSTSITTTSTSSALIWSPSQRLQLVVASAWIFYYTIAQSVYSFIPSASLSRKRVSLVVRMEEK